MRKIRYGLIVLWMLTCSVTSAGAQVSIGIGSPNVSIGINLPLYPELVRVPDYPVYYAPQVDANYFFFDGMYWVFQSDNWYASSWYNGPWSYVEPIYVPVYILRIPVSYYRRPPVYFRGWPSHAPPRWGQHWGHEWEQHRRGWDKWKRGSGPAPAPLPVYQRQYSGDRYPRQVEQQQTLHRQNYRYQPRDTAVRQHYQQQGAQRAPAPAQRGRQEERPRQPDAQHSPPYRPGSPAGPEYQQPRQNPHQQPGDGQREQYEPRPQGQERGRQEPERGHGQGPQR